MRSWRWRLLSRPIATPAAPMTWRLRLSASAPHGTRWLRPRTPAGGIAWPEIWSPAAVPWAWMPASCLADNDSYHYLGVLGDLIVTGPTSTNVNDLVFAMVSKKTYSLL